MKFKNNFNMKSRWAWFQYSTCIVLFALILTSISAPLQAQDSTYTKPSWWFGVAGGANFNYYDGSTQKLNADLTAPVPFHQGNGIGLYIAPLMEFHRPNSRWGIMLQAGFDDKMGKFKEVFSSCNCPRDLSVKLNYVTIEPSLRFAPFKSNFYLFGGPRFSFNMSKSFTFFQKTNPEFLAQVAEADVKGDLSDMNKMLISMQIGAGYDIYLSSQKHKTQFVLSPFVSFQPYLGQEPRTIETWTVATLRVGAAFKFGCGHKKTSPKDKEDEKVVKKETKMKEIVADSKITFSVNAPKNIPVERRVRETFPLRNYVFFNLGSTEIPNRYVLLNKSQVKDFKEEQLEVFTPKDLSGRSARQMTVYYNVLNILGDRMGKYPSSTITLVGSSEKGADDGRIMATSVKSYLTDVFGIDGSRITIEGRTKPTIPSEQPGSTTELDLLREGDRRVSILSTSPELLMEFQSGPEALLKPVAINAVQEAPPESYVTVNADAGTDTFYNWSLEITDDKGKVQNFGPYSQETVTIPGKSILGERSSGEYDVKMTGQTRSGKTITKDTTVNMVLWTPPKNEEGMRFSVIFEFNSSKENNIYEKYLTEIVTPKIPKGGTVIIHGHTDIIGSEVYNRKLSLARANDVKSIIEKALINAGRSDVKFELYGFGEDETLAPFENKFPEQRFYNRTVVIDIIPAK